jgi:hypothetical protein
MNYLKDIFTLRELKNLGEKMSDISIKKTKKEILRALRLAARYTWIGEKEFPGWCFFCGKHRMLHREGAVKCIQAKEYNG